MSYILQSFKKKTIFFSDTFSTQALFNLHYPPVPKNNFTCLLKPAGRREKPVSPKSPLKRERSVGPEKSAKKSRGTASPGGRYEVSPCSSASQIRKKQPIVLKPAVPLRKKLLPNTEQVRHYVDLSC